MAETDVTRTTPREAVQRAADGDVAQQVADNVYRLNGAPPVCEIGGCGSDMDMVTVERPDRGRRRVCGRCSEELVALYGYRLVSW